MRRSYHIIWRPLHEATLHPRLATFIHSVAFRVFVHEFQNCSVEFGSLIVTGARQRSTTTLRSGARHLHFTQLSFWIILQTPPKLPWGHLRHFDMKIERHCLRHCSATEPLGAQHLATRLAGMLITPSLESGRFFSRT